MTDKDVVRDPVTGRPLHEFVVDPLGAPTVLPVEGEPLDEPGTQQGPHGKPRRKPIMVFTVDRDVPDEDAIDMIVEEVLRARRKNAERRQSASEVD